jgi:hypothetical protein
MTTAAARQNPFVLVAALARDGDLLQAHGELFWDDGETPLGHAEHAYSHFGFRLRVTAEDGTLSINRTSHSHLSAAGSVTTQQVCWFQLVFCLF